MVFLSDFGVRKWREVEKLVCFLFGPDQDLEMGDRYKPFLQRHLPPVLLQFQLPAFSSPVSPWLSILACHSLPTDVIEP